MKAIIPVAGVGSRLRPQTHTQPTALIPVAGKPIIAHIIDTLSDAGYDEFVLVVGHLGDKIEVYITEKYPDKKIHFIYQTSRGGLGHAIWMSRYYINNSKEILIVLGDTVFDVDLKSLIQLPHSALGVKKVSDPRMFGVVELKGNNFIKKVVEKPKIPKSNLALVGLYKIKETKQLINALNHIIKRKKHNQKEIQLTDALMFMIEKGIKFQPFTVDNWYDCGKKDILLETNAFLLSRKGYSVRNYKKFINTIIKQPVSIAKDCKISNSIVGPNVSIGDNAVIDYSIIKDSIIGSYSKLENAVLQHSVIGNDASVKGISQSLNIGDDTEISFS